jgi:hypothetical protein
MTFACWLLLRVFLFPTKFQDLSHLDRLTIFVDDKLRNIFNTNMQIYVVSQKPEQLKNIKKEKQLNTSY